MSKQENRGKESNDDKIFKSKKIQILVNMALEDMNYLLSRGYGAKTSLQLVGNRYQLNSRQQKAILGMSASQYQIEQRKKSELFISEIENQTLIIDGFNLLILLESSISGAYIFKGLDGCFRDLSSVYGSYKKVKQTLIAIELMAEFHLKYLIKEIIWILDKPVSNSGMLKCLIEEIAIKTNCNWKVLLENNPDKYIFESNNIIVSSDAWILDRAKKWVNLFDILIANFPLKFKLNIISKENEF